MTVWQVLIAWSLLNAAMSSVAIVLSVRVLRAIKKIEELEAALCDRT